jgi:hypothetical protein
MRSKLTYSNVVSTLCLFLLLAGGGAYAASKLGKNSVGTKQLKRNAVTAAKIKKNAVTGVKVKAKSLTGKDINLNKLGTVPRANVADSASALAPPEAVHLVGTPGEPPFEKGSSNGKGGGGFSPLPVGFYKDHEGIVHLQGAAENPTEQGVFTLPPGYRPAGGFAVLFDQGEFGFVYVFGSNTKDEEGASISGQVFGVGSKEALFDGITFRAES